MKPKNTLILFILFFFSFSVSAFSLKEVNPDEVNSKIHYFHSRLKYGALVEYIDSLKTQDASLLLIKAKTQHVLGEVKSMEATLQQIFENNSNDVSVLGELANLAELSGNKEKAIWFLNRATQVEQLPSLMMQKGELMYALKRYE